MGGATTEEDVKKTYGIRGEWGGGDRRWENEDGLKKEIQGEGATTEDLFFFFFFFDGISRRQKKFKKMVSGIFLSEKTVFQGGYGA